ncbi:MAG: hypothetical protein ACHQTE_01245 [Candidatus Saccharimonadales bacterium]
MSHTKRRSSHFSEIVRPDDGYKKAARHQWRREYQLDSDKPRT